MKPVHIVAIVTGIVGVGVGLYFLLRNQLPSLLAESEEDNQPLPLQQEESPEEPILLDSPPPQKLALRSVMPRTPNVVYQNTKETQLIRDFEGRIERIITHTTVVDNG